MIGLIPNERFPSDKPYRVSVLIPTRGRPQKLARAISSLCASALDLDKIEILLRVDNDDIDTIGFLNRNKDRHQCKVTAIVAPRGNGYLDLHLYLASLAEKSQGNWLMNFNDDAIMLTRHWDMFFREGVKLGKEEVIHGRSDGIYLFVARVIGSDTFCEFFAIHSKVFEVLGHLSMHTGVDQWLGSLFQFLCLWNHSPITIDHINEEDETLKHGRLKIGTGEDIITDHKLIRYKVEDAVKLLNYIDAFASEESKSHE